MPSDPKESIEAAIARREAGDQWTALAPLPQFRQAEGCFQPPVPQTEGPLRVAVFNMERGQQFARICRYLQEDPTLRTASILLANELDDGMPRSGNRDVTAELAAQLGFAYARAVEFRELTGNPTKGLHCNAVFSRYPIESAAVLRLPVYYDWFTDAQKRLGTRVALFVRLRIGGKPLVAVCLHLENVSSPAERSESVALVLQHLEALYPDRPPVVLGGDLNTHTVDMHRPDAFLPLEDPAEARRRRAEVTVREPLFALLAASGFTRPDDGLTDRVTRRRHLPGRAPMLLNLDWLFLRDLQARTAGVADTGSVPDGPGTAGTELSDHNAVYCEIQWPPAQAAPQGFCGDNRRRTL